jgi:lactoylglutathione lyase
MPDEPSSPALRFGWTILHVRDVPEAIAFYERAFGFRRRFVAPQGEYGELETGGTTLAFAAHALVERLGAHGPVTHTGPSGFEVALVADEAHVEGAYRRAVAAGCEAVKPLARMPWCQTVGFVRDPGGVLVEICTPASAG